MAGAKTPSKAKRHLIYRALSRGAAAKQKAEKYGSVVKKRAGQFIIEREKVPGIRIKALDGESVDVRDTKFGQVVVGHAVPDAQTVQRNVDAGRQAFRRASEVLMKPGVSLRVSAGVPLFSVDAADPRMLVRELDGIIQRGHIVNGTFVPAD